MRSLKKKLNINSIRSLMAFSLLELLIVISIITILAALLLPALSTVRLKAKSIQCMNNLKQINLAINMYSNDNQGWFVPTKASTSTWVYWYMILGQNGYIATNSYASASTMDTGKTILHCPSASLGESSGFGVYYALNNYFCNVPTATSPGYTFLQIHKVKYPSLSVICADGYGTISPDYKNSTPSYYVYWRHPGANADFLFADGHIQPVSLIKAATLKWNNF